MADRRKLQGEIDKCIKKVNEGVETFEDIWKKVHNAANANQKEKYEADLKKEIKKLQRQRDQIKTWLASSEIKDKRQLIEYRKLIETQMERFKVVERETKTKAYSKEGLGAAQKLDPAQKEKDEITNWLSTSIEELSVQVDQFEGEVESLQVTQKKSKKQERDKQERTDFLKKRLEKHRYHIKQLETLMRMLDNETVEVNQIKKIKEDIEYYIESSQEADFEDNEYIYDDIDMENMQAFIANNVIDVTNAIAGKNDKNNKNETTNSSMENEENFSNSSSANESPAPSPGLQNSHSTIKSTTTATQNNIINNNNNNNGNSNNNNNISSSNNNHEFAFITNTQTTITTTTTLTSSVSPSTKTTTVWSSTATTLIKSSTSSSITQSVCSVSSTPYAAAVASSVANPPTKILQPNDSLNETRVPCIPMHSSSVAGHHEFTNHNIPSTSAVVTLYSAAAATPTVTSTASVTSNPWNTAVTISNNTEITNQTMNSRPPPQQLPNNNPQIQLTPQQQQYLLQQQQQQQQQQHQNNHILNGYKGISNVENMKGMAHQVVPSPGLDEQQQQHISHENVTLMSMNMPNLNMASNNPNVNSINPMSHLNDITNTTQNTNASMHMDHMNHTNLLKNNILMHQRSSQQMMPGNTPVSSGSPPNHLNSVPNNANNNSNNNNASNISNIEAKNNNVPSVNVNSMNNLVNQPVQNPAQNSSLFSNQLPNKTPLSKQHYIQMHLLESAFRNPIIPQDSYRLKPLTRLLPAITSPYPVSHYPNQTLPQFDNIDFYLKLTPETLFFIFYYMEGTKAQYMAAKALKNKSWRFHNKCMMWFQRLEEPRLITDDYETGTYIFFDFEKWSQRKKADFIFEYKYLEDKDLN